nr:hypothetical protein [bacterium]
MNRIISMSLLILSAQALWSCNPPDEYFNQRINLLPTPVALQDYMVLVDTNHEEAIMISASAEDQGESVRIPLPTGPFAAIERPGDYDEILILAAGHSGSRSRLQTPATLSRLDADGGLVSYELGNNPFDTMYVDEAGRYVFLTRKGLNNTLVENPNEIAVVNLVAAPSDPDAVTFITLEGLPLNVFYSKDFQINGTDKNLICVASVSTLFLIDLDHLERYPTVVYLGETEDAEPIIPEQVIFGADAARIYLRAPAASDIYSLKLNSRDTDGDRNDFATSIDIIGVEESPTDMILYTVDNQSFLFVVANHRFGHYIDVATGRTVTVSFAETITRAWYFSRIVDNVTTHHALLWTPN